MASSIQKVDKAIASINKGADKKEEMRMMMAPYANWDSFLVPAPMTIALLGQLILISADNDFSLQDKKNEIAFKLLKYPDSFRACLVQVSNSGWGAFNKAHTNMDQVRLYSGNVEGHVRNAVKFLISGSPQEVELMLPNALRSIENIADECVRLASSVEKEFVVVMEMVAELLEACTRAKGQYEAELKETEIAIQEANEAKKAIEDEKKEAEKKRENMTRQMKEAEQEYKEAMASVPSTQDIVTLAATDMVLGVAKNIVNMTNIFGLLGGKQDQKPTSPKRQSVKSESTQSATQSDAIEKFLKQVGAIKLQTTDIEKLACGNKENKREPLWDKIGASDGAQRVKMKLERLMKDMPKAQPDLRERAEKLCTDGINICETLLDLQNAMTKGDEEIADVMSQARDLSKDVEIVNSGLKIALGGNSLSNKSPQQAKLDIPQEIADDESLVKSAMQNARFKTEIAKEHLKDTRQMYDKSCQEVDERMKRMGEVMAELARFNPKKIDLESIRKTLIKGIHALAEVREQWGKLVRFFEMLSNLVKCCLQSSLQEFVASSKIQRTLTNAGEAMSDTMRDVLYEQAFKANQIAYVVNSISSVYMEVSDKHIMDQVTCLGKLIALDPDTDKQDIFQKRNELMQGCEDAQAAIKRIANEKKEEMMEAFDKRIGRIEREVESVMPPMPEAEVKEIQDQVKTAMKISKAAIDEELDDLV